MLELLLALFLALSCPGQHGHMHHSTNGTVQTQDEGDGGDDDSGGDKGHIPPHYDPPPPPDEPGQ